MATGVVLPLDRGLEQWHGHDSQTHHQYRPAATTSSSVSPSAPMTRSPPGTEAGGDGRPHKPRLPSFSNFLSGTGHPELKFAFPPPSPGAGRGDAYPAESRPLHSSHGPPAPTLYGSRDLTIARPSDSASNTRAFRQDLNHSPSWSYGNANSLERQPPLPPAPHHPIPGDRTYGRIVVAEEIIPGKGLCYIYDDGTICQKIINGDTVNPKWGTTKAGKPRKRLGQACNTCREKKIKCDPSVPKCAQCQKFNRECRFESATRAAQKNGSQSQLGLSPSSTEQPEDKSSPRRDSTASTDRPPLEGQSSKPTTKSIYLDNIVSPSSAVDVDNDDSPDSHYPSKKPRFSASPHAWSEGWPSDGAGAEAVSVSTSSPATSPQFSWRYDPYDLDHELTMYYLQKYFAHVDTTAYCTLPRRQYIHWVKTCTTKSAADRMMLYAILALGTIFGRRSGAEAHRTVFVDVAHAAMVKTGDSFSLQSVHTRLVLALLFFAQGQCNRAWDYCGSAMRNAFALRFNTEEGINKFADNEPGEFGLDRAAAAECRRRTFWSAYVMNCFDGCCSASFSAIYRSDCQLRLPCIEGTFEEGRVLSTPFDLNPAVDSANGRLRHRDDVAHVGLLGYLVQVATIFNEVMSRLSRSESAPCQKPELSADAFRQDIMARLDSWDQALQQFLERPQHSGNKKELISGLHVVYHYAAIALNRYVRRKEVDTVPTSARVKDAYAHARKLLELVQRLSNDEDKDSPRFRFAMTSPFSGFAITAALDVVTAARPMSDLRGNKSETMSLISSGVEALEGLAEYWDSARKQRGMIKRRLAVLLSTNKSGPSSHNGAFYFEEPMQSPFGLEQDLVYSIPRLQYFRALGWDNAIEGDGDFYRLDRR